MSKLFDKCTGKTTVIDKNLHGAFKLDHNLKDFMTTFQLSDTSILGEIGVIIPNHASLQAELYELTVYAPGGFLKAHVDESQSEYMFGSLVVCLPTQCSGGELIIHHEKNEIKYDWSSPASDPLNGLCWATFLSDSEHEVLPVTGGYRVTVTYNLYYMVLISTDLEMT